jgi:hypothetical protein
VFGEESKSRTQKSKLTEAEKKARQLKSKIKSMLSIFFGIKGIAHKEFVLAGQTVNSYTTVTFYGDCVKMCGDCDIRTG